MSENAQAFAGDRCVVVALVSAKDDAADASVTALEQRLRAAGAVVVGRLIQRRGVSRAHRPGGAKRMHAPLSAATVIGPGKVQELIELVTASSANAVVFLNQLTNAQRERLEELTGCRVVSSVPSAGPTVGRGGRA